MNKKTVKDINVKGKKVLVRVDFNVPQDEQGKITDDRRIREAVPTMKYLIKEGASKVILMSHMGRPKEKVVESLRLAPAAACLEKILGEKVLALKDCIGPEVKKSIADSKEKVVLLENLRFHKEEEANDPAFAKELASLGEIYVNDAFGTAHRAHASTAGVAKYLPAVAGFLVEKEMNYLSQAINNPAKPFVVILGGAKVSDKIMLVENMLSKATCILIAGGMAYTFLKALGKNIGNSLLEADKMETARTIMEKAKKANVQLVISEDFVITQEFKGPVTKIAEGEIPDGWQGVDIGPKTREIYKKILSTAKTIVWNGPVGVFEFDPYAGGTKELAKHIASLKGVTSIVGGGDTAAAVAKFGCEAGMTHISTGGGASLELLEGKVLPGIAALNDK